MDRHLSSEISVGESKLTSANARGYLVKVFDVSLVLMDESISLDLEGVLGRGLHHTSASVLQTFIS